MAIEYDGTVRFQRTVEELFGDTAEYQDFRTEFGLRNYFSVAAWVDDDRDEVVLVGAGHAQTRPMVVVDLESGDRRDGGLHEIQQAVRQRHERMLCALEVALEREYHCELLPELADIFDEEESSLAERLRVAVLLARCGDMRGAPLAVQAATSPAPDFVAAGETAKYFELMAAWRARYHLDEADFIVKHLHEFEGIEILDVLKRAARENRDIRALFQAFEQVGSAAEPALLELLDDSDPDVTWFAARAMQRIGPPSAAMISALIEALDSQVQASSGVKLREVAADVLGRFGKDSERAIPALERLADNDDDPQVRAIAKQAIVRIRSPDSE
jgi:hypothetical protein